MAKDLSALVRINDWEVDQKRRALADELAQLDTLEQRLENLIQEMEHERDAAAAMPTEGGITYAAYASRAMDRRDKLKDAIAAQEGELAKARENLREAFLEFKKYEITEERRILKMEQDLAKAEQADLDEIGLTIYSRKEK